MRSVVLSEVRESYPVSGVQDIYAEALNGGGSIAGEMVGKSRVQEEVNLL